MKPASSSTPATVSPPPAVSLAKLPVAAVPTSESELTPRTLTAAFPLMGRALFAFLSNVAPSATVSSVCLSAATRVSSSELKSV